ncbi:MAG: DUF1738 domain-containing protein [Bacteroidales bacterium]|nr:DUF1738 domain-containing protein [Bacteroidales bacterium]
MNRSEFNEKVMSQYADNLIKRLETMKAEGWKQGWISSKFNGLPQNWNGRAYSGSNSFFLFLHTSMNNFKAPVYVTVKQLEEINKQKFNSPFVPKGKWNEAAHLLKGAEHTNIIFWDISYRYSDTRKKVPDEVVQDLGLKAKSKEDLDKLGIERSAILRTYFVFNIDQTNLKDIMPKKYESVMKKFEVPVLTDETGMYQSKAIDRMLEKQEWVCPIKYDEISSSAYYRPSADNIVVPKKAQFAIHEDKEGRYNDGMEYYSTLIHEMAHSTGHPSRLNRQKDSYDREELVAEMSASVIGSAMGFDTSSVIRNNEEYLNGWLNHLKEKPQFIKTILSDVTKASNMIVAEIDKQKLALGEKPMLSMGETTEKEPDKKVQVSVKEVKEVKAAKAGNVLDDGAVIDRHLFFSASQDSVKLSISVDGLALHAKTVSLQDKFDLESGKTTLAKLAEKHFSEELSNLRGESQIAKSHSMKR